MVEKALADAPEGEKLQPADPRRRPRRPERRRPREGFYDAIEKHGGPVRDAIEVATEWDAATALANLEAAVTANPDIDFDVHLVGLPVPHHPLGARAARHVEAARRGGARPARRPRRRRDRLPAASRTATSTRPACRTSTSRPSSRSNAILAAIEAGEDAAERGDRGPGLRAHRQATSASARWTCGAASSCPKAS